MSTTTQTTIINRALQLLGYKSVGSINDNDRGARAMLRAWDPTVLSLLRMYHWNFAKKRASLTASATVPIFGKANFFPLPGDFVDLVPGDQGYGTSGNSSPPRTNDWQIEGNQIATDDASPILIRYISSSITPSLYDPSFSEALAATLAMVTCEELTQSNTKLASAQKIYDEAIKIAKQRNAFDNRPTQPPIDTWIMTRF